jgi:serine/threonine protein kinase
MAPVNQPDNLQRLGDFEIVRELGRGGMGVVYEARQVSLNRKVALKVLSGGLGLTGKAVQRFRREAEAAARLHHTNIVPVYATGEEDGSHFYAMELINGPSLDHVIKQLRRQTAGPSQATQATPSDSPSPAVVATGPYVEATSSGSATGLTSSSLSSGGYFDKVASAIAEVADALHYAHEQGVIHRDIKPSNLLLSPDGRLSVNDFGLARMLEQPGMTLTGEFVGTPAYMSPEQVTAGRIPLDHRTDIYSLGATLYELLTLQPPFTGKQRDQILAQIVQKEPKAPRKLNKKVPVDLETICLKALEKDPDRRYQTAGAMAEDLRRYINRFAISARRVGPVQRLVKWARRRPAVAACLACALMAVCIAAWFGYQAHAERQQHEAQLRAEKQRNAVERALLAALSGDFKTAEEAIRQAELLGASPGWIRMLNGQLALHREDIPAAVQDLEQAVRLMPDSVAAQAMLATAYTHAGQHDLFNEHLTEMERLDPVTPEDLLFKGEAEAINNPLRAIRTLDAAVSLRDSVLARAIRGQARGKLAAEYGDLAEAEGAVEDAAVARSLQGDNSYILATSVYAHVRAARVYERLGEAAKRKDHLALAGRHVSALEPFRDRFYTLWVRGEYYHEVGAEEAALEEWRRGAEAGYSSIVNHYVAALWIRGEFAKAEEACDRTAEKTRRTDAEVSRVYVLIELDRPRAVRSYQELAQRTGEGSPPFNPCYLYPTIARLLGDTKGADTLSHELRQSIRRYPYGRMAWSQTLLDYNSGRLSDDQLIAAAGVSLWDQGDAHFHAALRHLAKGQRETAREHFRASDRANPYGPFTCCWSRAFLARLEKDPTWPPWIPVKP